MTNTTRDVLHHIHEAEKATDGPAGPAAQETQVIFHIGCAIVFAILEVVYVLRQDGK